MINMDHGEYGVVLEDLCVQLYEYGIKVSDEDFERIKEAAKIIGINKDAYDFFAFGLKLQQLFVIKLPDFKKGKI